MKMTDWFVDLIEALENADITRALGSIDAGELDVTSYDVSSALARYNNHDIIDAVILKFPAHKDLFLRNAIFFGKLDQAKHIEKNGGNIYKQDHLLRNFLHRICVLGRPNAAKFLLGYNLDPNARDIAGRTPLFYCAEFNHPQTAKVLLENGAEKNIRDGFGFIPRDFLHHNHSKILRFLL